MGLGRAPTICWLFIVPSRWWSVAGASGASVFVAEVRPTVALSTDVGGRQRGRPPHAVHRVEHALVARGVLPGLPPPPRHDAVVGLGQRLRRRGEPVELRGEPVLAHDYGVRVRRPKMRRRPLRGPTGPLASAPVFGGTPPWTTTLWLRGSLPFSITSAVTVTSPLARPPGDRGPAFTIWMGLP